MSDRQLRRKSVTVTFAGDDDVLQHIVDANNQKGVFIYTFVTTKHKNKFLTLCFFGSLHFSDK